MTQLDPPRHSASPAPAPAPAPAPGAGNGAGPLPHAPQLGVHGAPCTVCGAPLASDQRYCLNCGSRRGDARVDYRALLGDRLPGREDGDAATAAGSPAAGAARESGSAARAITPLHAAAGLGLLLLAVIAGSVIGGSREPVAAQAPVVLGAAPTTPQPTTAAFTPDWPASEEGWTVQLQVLAKAGTTPEQIAEAKQAASGQGAADVGALDSDQYASLDAGNYVIYSGVFDAEREAKAALKDLEASFPAARVVEVSTAAAGDEASDDAAASDERADDALEGLENASPDDYVKKSRQLPDEVGTEGEAPPVDNKAPDSGGNDSATIG